MLAGDLGGTKTLLGLFAEEPIRPRSVVTKEYATAQYGGLQFIVDEFLRAHCPSGVTVRAAAIGVAGPVQYQHAQLTNVAWDVSARQVAEHTGLGRVWLLNDVEAMGYAVEALAPGERVELQAGRPQPDGNAALLTIGTGVGTGILHRVNGRLVPVPSEGGHADFAVRTEREIALLRALRPRYSRVEVERVVSGRGLANVARFTHGGSCPLFPPAAPPGDEPAFVTQAALSRSCEACVEALDIFVEAMGAVAGNLALTAVASSGVFLGGGVPPKILPALQSGRFVEAFNAKSPVQDLVERMPVWVVTMPTAGLLGAAVYASRM